VNFRSALLEYDEVIVGPRAKDAELERCLRARDAVRRGPYDWFGEARAQHGGRQSWLSDLIEQPQDVTVSIAKVLILSSLAICAPGPAAHFSSSRPGNLRTPIGGNQFGVLRV